MMSATQTILRSDPAPLTSLFTFQRSNGETVVALEPMVQQPLRGPQFALHVYPAMSVQEAALIFGRYLVDSVGPWDGRYVQTFQAQNSAGAILLQVTRLGTGILRLTVDRNLVWVDEGAHKLIDEVNAYFRTLRP